MRALQYRFDRDFRRFEPAALGVLTAVFAIAVALRWLEYPDWVGLESVWWQELPILPTADAYAWLAGATDAGRFQGWPLSVILSFFSGTTGLAPEQVAFWLPLALAPLPGLLVAGFVVARGYRFAGLVAGVFAASSIGYLARTRLGFFDTDLLALTAAVAMAWSWSSAAAQLSNEAWPDGVSSRGRSQLYPALLVFSLSGALYPSGYPVALAILVAGAAYAVVAARGASAYWLPVAVAALVACLHFPLAGPIAGALLWAAWTGERFGICSRVGAVFCLALVLVLIAWLEWDFLALKVQAVAAYVGVATPAAASGWSLPDIAASIQETGLPGAGEFVLRTGGNVVLLFVGLAGFAAVLVRFPSSITFLPLLALGLSSGYLGQRFAMYAGPVIGLGLGLGTAVICDWLATGRRVGAVAQALVLAIILVTLGSRAMEMKPSPALAPGHVNALHELAGAGIGAGRGRVWTWWDAGYAAQYFGRLPTVADGASASRRRSLALATVLGARDPASAATFMRLSAEHRARLSQDRDAASWRQVAFAADPIGFIGGLEAVEAQRRLEAIRSAPPACAPSPLNEYLVVSWSTLLQSQWVDRFASWHLTEGAQGFGRASRLAPPVNVREQQGILETPAGPVLLKSIDVLTEGQPFHREWPRNDGVHAVINNDSGEGVLMESRLYRMNVVQMLIADPARFDTCFELISDRSPAARIYRVR